MRSAKTPARVVLLLITVVSACADPALSIAPPDVLEGRVVGPSDPKATWTIPLDDASLSLRSDGLFSDGTQSVYANGVCTVAAKIYATAQFSNTGDATFQSTYPKGGKCGRTITLVYPDGDTQTLAMAANLNQLQNTNGSTIIAPGQSAFRRLIISFTVTGLGNPVASRCGRLIFGNNGAVGAGTDMLLVTRVDASTWHVQSQGGTSNRALCETLGVIYPMTVDFTIVASAPQPTE